MIKETSIRILEFQQKAYFWFGRTVENFNKAIEKYDKPLPCTIIGILPKT